MALVLQQRLAPRNAVLGGCCHPLQTKSVGGESVWVGALSSVNVWRMKSIRRQVGRNVQQCQTGLTVTALVQQQTSGTNSSPSQKPSYLSSSDSEGRLSPAKVFEDEAHGICCYRASSGEVTCEGHDEGPHFQPAASRSERMTKAKSSDCESSSMEEGFSYKYVTGVQGKCWCEGKDEC